MRFRGSLFRKMSERGWVVCTDGVTSINCWRWTVIENYTLPRWYQFLKDSFPNVKGYAIGTKLFTLPVEGEDWGERRLTQELDAVRDALSRFAGRELNIFVKDQADLRREKYQAQQAAKQAKAGAKGKEEKAKSNNNNAEKKQFHNTQKKEKKKKEGGGGGKQQAKAVVLPGHIDLRVGKVLSAKVHPDGDTLYVEEIDVGEEKPRTIVSGIRQHVTLEQFVGSRILVMCNLKEKPLRGVPSNGMIVCASQAKEDGSKTVRLLDVPDVPVGSRVVWGEEVAPDAAPLANKKLARLLGGMRTDADGNMVWGDDNVAASVDGKAIACKELPNGNVG